MCVCRYCLSTLYTMARHSEYGFSQCIFWVPIVLCNTEIYAAVLSCDWLGLRLCLSNSASMSDFSTTQIFTSIIYERICAVFFSLNYFSPNTDRGLLTTI